MRTNNNDNRNYLQLDDEQKDFIQRLLFLDYVEDWEQSLFKKGGRGLPSVKVRIEQDLKYLVNDEEYEQAQLYYDILKRYENDFDDFE